MSGKRLYHTEAIVLRRRDQGEADRVLTLCTPLGKLAVIAKGVRKVRSRKAGHLELFTHARLVLARSRSSWDVVTQAETVAPNAVLRGDLVRGTYGRYVAELYDRFVAEGEGSRPLFDLVQRTLTYLCEAEPGRETVLLMRAYEQRLLALVGFRPEWDRCVGDGCGHPLEPGGNEPFGLDPERGGALCPDCYRAARGERGVVPLSPPALRLLRACQREPFSRLRARPVPPGVLNEVERAARHYITYHLEQDLRSGVFLRRVWREREHRGDSGNAV
ncbi:MAG TPA: DNA repair protein RecO [Thermoflexia bacterium]|nr:DNA repair protein RecO [Thermoflexia bacterium]